MATPTTTSADIHLTGVRTHNLQNVDVTFPAGRLSVVSGPSGSGKSSLAFDTLYAEGQRRYVESLSAYTRQFLERMDRPDVLSVTGIPPAIAVERKPPAKTSRSTVGTVTEIVDYLRMLYARVATLTCLSCGRDVHRGTTARAVEAVLGAHEGRRGTVVFPLLRDRDDHALSRLRERGYFRLTPDGRTILDLHDGDVVSEERPLYVVADRLKVSRAERTRLSESLEIALVEGADSAGLFLEEGEWVPLSRGFHCPHCNRAYPDPTPALFSFNSPMGACERCRGFGDVIDLDPERVVPDPAKSLAGGAIVVWQTGAYKSWQRRLLTFCKEKSIDAGVPWSALPPADRQRVFDGEKGFPGIRGFFKKLEGKIYKLHVRVLLSRYRRYVPCTACNGARLKPEALAYTLGDRSIGELTAMPIDDAIDFVSALTLEGQLADTAAPLRAEITRRLDVLKRAGLGYLSLDRPSRTLSGGEYQRILLAGALGSGLVGTLYVLDEPSVGLHARDGDRLLDILFELRDAGNTVVVVEHDRDMIRRADHLVDLGPGAGEAGGRVVYAGSPKNLERAKGATADYLTGRKTLPPAARRDVSASPRIGIRGARLHNLHDLDVDIPLGGLVCVTGVSGSGKSTLVEETLYEGYRSGRTSGAGAPARITGLRAVSDILLVDQSPIGRTPRSNPVTYIKAFDGIRKLFADTREARRVNLTPGSFSFNVAGGRCETCEGAGHLKIELQFLADVYVTCDACNGRRYQRHVLEVRYRDRTITDVLALTVKEAIAVFADTPAVSRPLWHLDEVGLGYLRLGQPATTLSGGEAQRLKIALHLTKRVKGNALFILDEPTTGLHLADLGPLLRAFDRLIHRGNSVLVVEHNLDIIARADHVIDLGPEGGAGGGRLVAEGTPEAVARVAGSHTGAYLARYLAEYDVGVRKRRAKGR